MAIVSWALTRQGHPRRFPGLASLHPDVEVRRADGRAARASVGAALEPVASRLRTAHGRHGTAWFRIRFLGEALPRLYDHEDPAFEHADPARAEADFAPFAEECDLARKAVGGASLDEEFTGGRGRTLSLRWVYAHMVEEYARHNGHADLLRQRIDGATGS
jgi:hypothetical protein